MKQSIHLIGGQYRGKKITFQENDTLRPTPVRVRETLFNWLMHDIQQAHCLDAFAGSGALGLEAFSRGASQVVFLEQHKDTCQQLHKTIAAFNPHRPLTVIHTDACHFLETSPLVFDIVFLDPPFHEAHLMPCLNRLATREILKPGGLVYAESAMSLRPNEQQWSILKQKKAGQVYYALLQKHKD